MAESPDGRVTKASAIWMGAAGLVVLGAIQATWNMASGLFDIRDELNRSIRDGEMRTVGQFGEITKALARLEVRVDGLERAVAAKSSEGR